jgi:(1->4)-alpha-D-glucan 1-alpha-D-glucosylmutase
MRLAVLSEMPTRWAAIVRNWSKLNASYRTQLQPERNIEYLFYQTLVGSWPIETDRLQAYMLKAAREAKQFTSWTAPAEDYERALANFIDRSLQDSEFRAQVQRFVTEIKPLGYINSLSQTLLKLTSPGVPDIYQGSELWDFRLVDPDNRTPVDYQHRRQLLKELDDLALEKILSRWDDALPKLWLIRRTLAFRQSRADLFADGAYQPLIAKGGKAQHVVAFNRAGAAITIVSRFPLGLNNDWQDTTIEIPPGKWRNLFTGDAVAAGRRSLSELLRRFPVALLAISGPVS